MKTPHSYWRALLLSILLLVGGGRTLATTFETVESSYLGDGWFQYRVKMFYDPFFLQSELVEFGIIITNGVDVQSGASPTGWSSTTNPATWSYTSPDPQPRPSDQIFLMHSSSTNYMLGTNAISLWSLITSEVYPAGVVTANMVGYGIVPCLLPCPPEMADNSPTNHLEIIEFVPDPVIKKLMVGPSVYGLVFDWASDSTDLLQASRDMINWTNVTYLYGNTGETVWTTNQHLLDNGQYFRLLLAAGFHTTNVAPLTASSVKTASAIKSLPATTSTPRVTSCKPQGDVVSVEVATVPGQSGEVRMVNSRGAILQMQPFNATGNSVVVYFSAKNISGPMLFQAVTGK